MKISFIIPCYNTTDAINHVIEEISDTMKDLNGYDYEIILVNDASPDISVNQRLRNLVNERNEKLILINLAKNSGQPNAILTGFRYGVGDLFMTADDDGQTPMDKIPDFLNEIRNGKDVVCAKYIHRDRKSIGRKLGTLCNNFMAKQLIHRPPHVELSTIFIAKKFVVEEMIKYDQPYAYLSGLILRVTHNVGNVEVDQRKREIGGSGYSFSKLLKLWANGATSFSVKPLRIADCVGLVVALCGFIMALITIVRKILNVNVLVGWSSMMSAVLILAGINLLVLGVMGEYIGRIYLVLNKTPQSVVKDVYTRPSQMSSNLSS